MRDAGRSWQVVGGVLVAVGMLGGCATSDGAAAPETTGPAGQLDAGVAPGAVSSPVLCAEFPPSRAPGDGWWNASPATADGAVVRDSSDWPDPRPREHPRVVLVDVDEGVVLSAWDRVACDDDIPGYVPPAPGPGWEPGTIVVLDADTGELLDSMTGPLTSAG